MASTARILLVGSCSGNVIVLMKRLQTVSDKSGPFDAAFCVGPFFPDDGTDDGPTSEELSEYLRGDKQSPVATYFIGGFGTGSQVGLSQASPSKSNVKYLGRCGLVRVKGLTVAFLDGTHSNKEFRSSAEAHQGLGCRHYTEGDMQSLKRTVNSADGDVDLLLTCEWPRGIVEGLPDVPAEAKHPSRSSYGIAELALAVRPRYHVAASKELFYTRMPYLNQDLGAGAHVTRFVGLGAVGNQAKQKWLHALQLTPAAYMDQEAMLTKPSDTTPCPFEALGLGSRKRGMAQDDEQDLGFAHVRWRGLGKKGRYEGRVSAAPSFGRPDVVTDKRKSVFVNNISFKAEESDLVQFFAQAGKVVDVRRTLNSFGKLNGYAFIQFETVEEMQRACQLSGMKLMGRDMRVDPSVARDKACIAMGTAVADCWFCLSNPNADVHLVISVGEESYLAVDKGAINDTHCLVLPIDHYPSLASLPASCFLEMHRFVNALRSCVAAQGMVVVGFERFLSFKNRGGNHAHVNLVGVRRAQGDKAAALFEKKLGEAGMSCQTLPSLEGRAAQKAIQDVVGDGEYFLALLPDSSILVHPLLRGEKLPMNLGREVLAELAKCPDRADWHACEESREIQVARAESFKSSFGDYDIMAS